MFRTFPRSRKSAEIAASPSPKMLASSSSWTPAAYEAPDPRGGAAPGLALEGLQEGPCGCVPLVIGAPSHTHGLSCTGKPQPMSTSSLRTFLNEAVVGGGRRRIGRGAAGAFLHPGGDQQRQVPAARGSNRQCLRFSYPQSGGHSCCTSAKHPTSTDAVLATVATTGRLSIQC